MLVTPQPHKQEPTQTFHHLTALCYIIKHTATSGSGTGSGFVLLARKSATGTSVEFTVNSADALEMDSNA